MHLRWLTVIIVFNPNPDLDGTQHRMAFRRQHTTEEHVPRNRTQCHHGAEFQMVAPNLLFTRVVNCDVMDIGQA